MKTVQLVRKLTDKNGTRGTIFLDDVAFYTLELPDLDNKPMVSCIPLPKPHYKCEFTYSEHFPEGSYQVMNVPGRVGIRFHSGNYAGSVIDGYKSDVLGCIILGTEENFVDKQLAVQHSKDAVKAFESALGKEPFLLEINEQYPGGIKNV